MGGEVAAITREDRSLSVLSRLPGGREVWALSDQALVSGANFLTNIMIARALGLKGFGVFALCWMVLLLLSSIQMSLVVLPMMALGPKQDNGDKARYYGGAAVFALFVAVACAALVSAGTWVSSVAFPSWGIQSLAFPLAAAVTTYLLQDFVRRYFFTLGRSRAAISCDAVSYLLQLPILWLLSHYGSLTSARALWIIAFTSAVSVVVVLGWLRPLIFSTAGTINVVRLHWKSARFLVPSAILQWSASNLFVVFAPVYYGAEAAGAMRACQNIVAVVHIWFLGLDNVIPAEASRRLSKSGIDATLAYIRNMLVGWGTITLLFLTVICVAPSFWLHLLYGARFEGADQHMLSYVLQLYSVLYLMVFLGGPLRAGLQAIEYTAPILWSYIAMTAFAAVAAAPLAKRLGIIGVMIGLIVTQLIFQSILAIALVLRSRKMRSDEVEAGNEAILNPLS